MHPNAADATVRGVEAVDGNAVLDADVRQGCRASADVVLDERTARADDLPVDQRRGAVPAGLEPAALVEVHDRRSVGRELVHDPGEPRIDRAGAPRQQRVRVPTLRHALARAVTGRRFVAVDDGHGLEVVGEDAGGGEATDAAADHNGVASAVTVNSHGEGPPASGRARRAPSTACSAFGPGLTSADLLLS